MLELPQAVRLLTPEEIRERTAAALAAQQALATTNGEEGQTDAQNRRGSFFGSGVILIPR